MFIVNTPICPQCKDAIMSRGFSTLDNIVIFVFIFIFFPPALFLYLSPRSLHCHNCGNTLSDAPREQL